MGQYYSDGRDTMAANFATSTATAVGQLQAVPAVGNTTGAIQRGLFRTNAGASSPFGAGETFVSDGFLGWEVNVGCDWKLLEHLTLKTRYAYWQPGEWFNLAYQAIVPITGTTTSDANGVLGLRDPIQAFEGSFVIDF
jgi:hypothetical protein